MQHPRAVCVLDWLSRPPSARNASFSRTHWCALTLALVSLQLVAQVPSALTLRVSTETAAAGGWAQIKVFADSPALIGGGVLSMDLDPKIFGPIASVAAFSASGDAIGAALVNGTHVDAAFNSPSGGIGQLPGIPVFVVRAPVLAGADSSGFVSLSLPASSVLPLLPIKLLRPYPEYAWTDAAGNPYQVSLVSGGFSRFGTRSVENVTPGAGLHAAGTVLHVDGTGFDAGTKVSADGLAISSMQYVSSTRIDVTIGGARELTGVRFHIDSSNGSRMDFFAEPSSAPTPPYHFSSVSGDLHVILPLREQKSTAFGSGGATLVAFLYNPSDTPVDVLLRESGPDPVSGQNLTLAPGTIIAFPRTRSIDSLFVDASAPIRIAAYSVNAGGAGIVSAGPASFSIRPLMASVSPSAVAVNYQAGTPNPAPQTVGVSYFPGIQDFTVQVDAGSWLKVTTQKSANSAALTLAFDATGLSPGAYTGTITINPIPLSALAGFPTQPSTVRITLNVTAQPTIQVQSTHSALTSTGVDPLSIMVTSNGSLAAFTVKASTDSGGDWLSTDVTSGVTPATVNLKANPGSLPGGTYRGHLTVQGPANRVTVDTAMLVYPLPASSLRVMPTSVSFTRESGVSGPFGGSILSFQPVSGMFNLTVNTDDGGNWLEVMNNVIPGNPTASAFANVNASNLAPGNYHGTITGTSSAGSATVDVSLTVVTTARRQLTVSPSSLSFTTTAGVQSAAQTLTVESPDGMVLFNVEQSPPQIGLTGPQPPNSSGNFVTPSKLSVSALTDVPGTYQGTLILATSVGKVSVPVTVNVTAGASTPPLLASVVNAASQVPGPLSPGEVITIRGVGVGPAPVGLQLNAQGRVLTSASSDARVVINGIPAPIVYGSPDQWNVIVPYEVDGVTTADVQVFSGGTASAMWKLPVTPSAPGIFTIGSTGAGRGAVLNQDNTVNDPSNPAASGTVIQIFATGGGQLLPAGVTGSVSAPAGSGATKLPVRVSIGGRDAPVVYAGPVPGIVSGVLQINAVVPSGIFSNSALPLFIDAGGVISQPGVTIAVR